MKLTILIGLFGGGAKGFNFDTRFPYLKQGPSGSNFGYSVESFQFENGKEEIIVGAPTYQDETTGQTTGAIFQCPFSTSEIEISECERISSLSSDYQDSRYGQTLATTNDRLIACAPKYSELIRRRKPSAEVESIIGSCDLYESGDQWLQKVQSNQLLDRPVDQLDHRAPYQERRDTFDYAKAQFGISVTTSNEGDVLVGAAGTQAWSGSIVTGELGDRTFAESPHCDDRGDERKSPRRWCAKLSQEVDSYGGSATAILTNVAGYPNEKIYAMGAPGDQKYGSVRFYRRRGNDLAEIPELALVGKDQFKKALNMNYISTMGGLASAFGYAMTVIDLNGDGYDDLIVGAPQYYDAGESVGGAVFIFFSAEGKRGFSDFRMLTGPEGSSFGHSLASLGDADIDEYGDFCVGAPHARHATGNTGSIYMYNGQKRFSQIPTQIVTADDVDPINRTDIAPVDGIQSFGLALKGNIDLDNDGHPDLIVGAKDLAVVLRARPIISISSEISVTDSEGNQYGEIDLESEEDICDEEGESYHCFNVNVCFSFDKSTIKQLSGSRAINLTMIADSKLSENQKVTSRARIGGWKEFSNRMTKTTDLDISSSGQKCLDPVKVYLTRGMKDKLTPVIISIDFALAEGETEMKHLSNQPVIRINGDKHVTKSINIKNNCRLNNFCDDNLKVDNPVIFYLDGKKWIPLAANSALSSNTEPRLKWTARVTNQDGEDAYNAGFTTKLPVFFKLNRFEIEPVRENFDCTEFTTMSHNYIKCNVDNPFRANSQATVSLYLDLIYNTLSSAKDGSIETWSHKTEHPELAEDSELLHRQARGPSIYSNNMYASANIIPFSFGEIVYESELQIVTETSPSYIPVIYSPSESLQMVRKASSFDDIGEKMTSVVIVRNQGKTPAKDIDVTIKIPTMVKDDHLLYVVSSKVMTKNHRYECQIKGGDFNMDGLKESRKKRDISDVGSERGLGGVMYDETMRMYVPKAHELGCRHDWVHCAEIICQISNLGVSEIAHIEIESYVAQQALQHHFSGSQMFDIIWTGKVASKWPLKGKTWSKNTLRVDQEVVMEKNMAFYLSWWIIALICLGVFGIFMLILVTLYLCGFFTRDHDIYKRC